MFFVVRVNLSEIYKKAVQFVFHRFDWLMSWAKPILFHFFNCWNRWTRRIFGAVGTLFNFLESLFTTLHKQPNRVSLRVVRT